MELQASEETCTGARTAPPVTVPPVAKSTMPSPAGEDATLLSIPIAVELSPAAMVRFTTATTPFEMMLASIAEATHEKAPAAPLQFNAFPAVVRAAPEFTEMETTLAGG